MEPCHLIGAQNAKEFVENGSYQKFVADSQGSSGRTHDLDVESTKVDKKDERRRKAAGGKAGGGAQGRETKTKSTKKHARGGGGGDKDRHSDSDDDGYSNKKKSNATLDLITVKEIERAIAKPLDAEGLGDLADLLARQFYP